MKTVLEQAVSLHQNGELAVAEKLYRKILSKNPELAVCLNLLGLLLFQNSKFEESILFFKKAIQQEPDNWLFHANLAQSLQALGRLDEAVAIYEKAVELEPNIAAVHNNLGTLFKKIGKPNKAVQSFTRAIACDPCLADAHNNLGTLLEADGDRAGAVSAYRAALRCNPSLAQAHYNLASVLHVGGEFDDAMKHYREAVSLNGELCDAHLNMAKISQLQDASADAVAHYRSALQGRKLSADNHANFAVALQEINDFAGALRECDEALRIDPEHEEARYNRFFSLLTMGRMEDGWAAYEFRKSYVPRNEQRWRGERMEKETLLVFMEQGLGDVLQFVRYAPQVAERVGRVIYHCHSELLRLLPYADGVRELTDVPPPEGSVDRQIPIASLPFIFGGRLDQIPCDVPYIRPQRSVVPRLAPFDGMRIGIVWAGNPRHGRDRLRSARLSDFAPLAALPSTRLVSLQKGEPSAQLAEVQFPVEDAGKSCSDMFDTAQIILELDGVISVDTSVAHLAGALGKPVWAMVTYSPDWRWLLEREDTPWYPTMRLFRQSKPMDWSDTIQKMAACLSCGDDFSVCGVPRRNSLA